jgi:hydroxymethylbilane synthase
LLQGMVGDVASGRLVRAEAQASRQHDHLELGHRVAELLMARGAGDILAAHTTTRD